jgi:hypothetical protein
MPLCPKCCLEDSAEHQELHKLARQLIALMNLAREMGFFMAFGPFANMPLER